MLRDVPWTYVMMYGFLVLLVSLMTWFGSQYERGANTLQLNELLITTATTEVDQQSRVYDRALLLSDNYESAVWERIAQEYPKGTQVQFDYIFDTEDERFTDVPDGSVSSPTYIIGGEGSMDIPQQSVTGHMTDKPVLYTRVKIRTPDTSMSNWTYISTIGLDALSRE